MAAEEPTMKMIRIKAATEEEEPPPVSPFSRLFQSPEVDSFIIVTLGCGIRLNSTTIIDGLKLSLINHPRFSSIPEMGRGNGGKPVWVQTKVNVEDHVFVPDIDPDMESPDQFLEDYISNLTTIPMDMSKPLWELHLLQVKSSVAESVGVFKIHHSLGDGMSLMSLLLACTRKTSDPEALPAVSAKKNHVGPSSFLGKIWWLVAGSWWITRLVFNTCVDLVMTILTICFLRDTKTPIVGGAEHKSRRFIHRIISLDDVKIVKTAMKMTINDVLVGVTQAGLSRYLSRRHDQETTSKSQQFPKRIRLRGAVFMNLRPTTGIKDLADMMAKGSKCRWGNWIGYVLIPFTVGSEADPLEHVRRAKYTMERKKLSLEAVFSYAILSLTMTAFGLKALEDLTRRIFERTTLTFSNMVGPEEEVSFYGHPITYIAPSAFGLPHGLTLHFQSYAKKMIIIVAVDPTVIPDPHQLCDDLVESLSLFKSAVLERGSSHTDVKKLQ
ncbi:PREDICTED: O-acyltransferase WSD1-like isoform X2 [Tarenaya hassleriana]|uniref:O-acyltransferase WSD1-like isoform X2 n=1 Tax=Tarenaya hassleriana TaxID=28532 RepID=UPI00053C3BB6|nr:PREDICTED: O-acyltransferase WSD1-like isoform X2 [Tarenaya hassleriana]